MGRNRADCRGGSILIRTTLMKDQVADLADAAELGHPSLKFGAGVVFSEAHLFAAVNGKAIASGTEPTVGIAGWTLGGGHGPLCPSLGVGSDNLLAVDIVLASGEAVHATAANKYSDLLKALKGGGGSTWGVITHLYIRAHEVPAAGYTVIAGGAGGDMCDAGLAYMNNVVGAWNEAAPTLNSKVGQIGAFTVNSGNPSCEMNTWSYQVIAVVSDGNTSAEAQDVVAKLEASQIFVAATVPLPNFYLYAIMTVFFGATLGITPWPGSSHGVPSALVPRTHTAELTSAMVNIAASCNGECSQFTIQ
eukprot:gene7633-11695_t